MIRIEQRNSFIAERREHKLRQTPNPDEDWKVYGSPLSSYEEDFSRVLGGEPLASFLRGRKSPVVLDLMAPSDTLSDLFTELDEVPNKTGIAVSLEDKRSLSQKERDLGMGITQLTGDLVQGSTWKKIQDSLGVKKADLILERGAGGIYNLPFNERLFAAMLGKMWNMLTNENGTMIIQTPSPSSLDIYGIRFPQWLQSLNKIPAHVDIMNAHYTILKIIKTPDSPQHLPQLPRS